MEKMDISDLVRVATAAERKGVSTEALYGLIRAGKMCAVEIDGVKFVQWSLVENYIPRDYVRKATKETEAGG